MGGIYHRNRFGCDVKRNDDPLDWCRWDYLYGIRDCASFGFLPLSVLQKKLDGCHRKGSGILPSVRKIIEIKCFERELPFDFLRMLYKKTTFLIFSVKWLFLFVLVSRIA